jgi:hypothetical protein
MPKIQLEGTTISQQPGRSRITLQLKAKSVPSWHHRRMVHWLRLKYLAASATVNFWSQDEDCGSISAAV